MVCLSMHAIPKQTNNSTWMVRPRALPKTDGDVATTTTTTTTTRHKKNNRIKTTKYTILSFFPKNLFEQFHRFANLYFLFIIVLNFIPQINAFGKEISMIPLIFVLAVTAIKDLVEDRQRYLSDRVINGRLSDVYETDKEEFRQKKWHSIEVGDVIKLHNNEIIPCDVLVLNSSDENGLCHLSSANLDGESNLKEKRVPKGFLEDANGFQVKDISFYVKCEPPNNRIHSFYGSLVHRNGEEVGVDRNNLLLRGCVLKNTEYIYGLVVYAGHDTKSMLNDSGTRYKRSQLEKDINADVIGCVVILFMFCLIGAICCGFWTKNYAPFEESMSTNAAEESYTFEGFLRFWTFVIILQVIIPISLYVSVEIVKLGQVFYINRDQEMIHKERSQYPICRATNINEDLGQIHYIFSDKTGTLTENKMVFKKFAILGNSYLHPEGANEDITAGQCQTLRDSIRKEHGPEFTDIWNNFFTALTICNTVVVAKQPNVSNETLKTTILNSTILNSSTTSSSSEFNGKTMPNGHVVAAAAADSQSDSCDEGAEHILDKSLPSNSTKSCRVPDDTRQSHSTRSNNNLKDLRRYTYSRTLNHRLSRSVESISSWLECGLFPEYEYESPDEGALVKASSLFGYTLLNKTPDQIFFTRGSGEIVIFDVLHVLQFDSVRKRMSVVVQDDERRIVVYCKGADTEIMGLLKDGQDEIQLKTNDELEEFAREGLRTLCVAMRILTEEEYGRWLEHHKEAEVALEDRDRRLTQSACSIETELTLLGATGIEDKLQDGVPETIDSLKSAGINLWILTGDKQETAVNIGFACKLLHADMEIITINSRNMSGCNELLDQIIQRMNSKWPSYTVLPTTRFGKYSDKSDYNRPPMALIIDGVSLAFTLEKPLDKKFIEIARHCESVICCRAAPLQKAAVVRLVRDNLKVMTLAIGDGANDVSMLQMAEIGVGIAGHEGVQAVMASDFVLGRFRFLKRLLSLHGFWCYDRIARMILYFFFKNTMFVGLLFWYQIFNGFSGSCAIDDVSLIIYNLLLTSLPPIICGIWDQCIPECSVLLRPTLYQWGQKGKGYTRRLFWLHILDSLFQSVVLFFVPYFTFSDLPSGGMLVVGVTYHQLAVITANLHLTIETPNLTVLHAVVIIGSILLSYIYYFIYCAISPDSYVYWAIYDAMWLPEYWFLTLICPVVALMPRLLLRVAETMFFPSIIQQVRKHIRRKGSANNVMSNLSHPTTDSKRDDICHIETSTPT